MNTHLVTSSSTRRSLAGTSALSLFAAITVLAAGLSVVSAQSQQSWAQSYGTRSYDVNGAPTTSTTTGSGSDYATGIAPMPDGGFVVAGYIDLPELYLNSLSTGTGDSGTAALVRYAPDGTIVWQHMIRQDNDGSFAGKRNIASTRVNKVLADTQGNIFVIGDKGNGNNEGYFPFAAKFDASGALMWQRGIFNNRINPNQRFTGAITRDGGVLVALNQDLTSSGGSHDPALAKLNSDGSLAFYAVYDQAFQYLETLAVCESATENNVFVAVVRNGFGVTLLRIDESGNLLAVRDTRDGSSSRPETPVAVVATSDGGFATLSRVGQFATEGVVLRKFNQSLVPTLEKWIQRANTGSTSNQFNGDALVAEADGSFLIGGNTTARQSGGPLFAPGGGGTEAVLMRVSAAGELQFVSALGGPNNEGRTQSQGPPSGATYVQRAADGGYAFTTYSFSYRGEATPAKSDWWTAKTDQNRRVRNFAGLMADLPLEWFRVTDVPDTGSASPAFTRAQANVTLPIAPGFIIEDLANKTGINKPDVIFQGSSPRIVSTRTAEAVVGQHFTYRILAGLFDRGRTLTYSTSALPAGFRFNPETGVISGAPKPGTETTAPLLITIAATDGVDTAQATLSLTIGGGVPFFTVNDSDQPAFPPSGTPVAGLADKPLSFAARYAGRRASQIVGVQATTTPGDSASWRNLDTGTDGYMTFDEQSQRFVLLSTNYPAQSGVYFRAISRAPHFPDATSNIVGPFELGSATPRVGRTLFRILRNGRRADLDFRANIIPTRTDAAVRVQSTTKPAVEASWTDIQDETAGRMTQAADSGQYSHTTNKLPPGDGLYFRAVAAVPGSVTSLSNIIGPYTIYAATPPAITITSPAHFSPEGESAASPLIINTDASGTARFKITVQASSKNFIKSLQILVDGSVIHTVTGGATEASIDYTSGSGDHVIQGVAVDEFNATGRAGTSPLYVRIMPGTESALRADGGGETPDTHVPGAGGAVFLVANSGGRWDDPATWNRVSGSGNVPGADDFAILEGSTVQLGGERAVGLLSMREGGRIVGPGILRINRTANIFGGSIEAGVQVIVERDAHFFVSSGTNFRLEGFLENFGEVQIRSERGMSGLSRIINSGELNFYPPLVSENQLTNGLPLDERAIYANLIENSGRIGATLIGQDGAGLVNKAGGSIISGGAGNIISGGAGNIISGGAGNIISGGAGNIISSDGASIISSDGASIISGGAGNIISGGAGNIISGGAGNIISGGGGNIISGGAGNLLAPSSSSATTHADDNSLRPNATGDPSGFVQSGGEVNTTGVTIIGEVKLNGGLVTGSGLVAGSMANDGGYVSPGDSPGGLVIAGNYTQNTNGTLVIEASGGASGEFDQVLVSGAATLGGQLIVKTLNGYVPFEGDPFNPLGYGSVSGSFSSISSNVQVNIGSTGIGTTLDPNAANPPAAKLLNIATRMRVEQGDNALIAGFIVTGNAPKKVLIRGIGPSLPVSGPLADPILSLDNGAVVNDDWKSTQEQEIRATTIPPSSDLESAIVATLQPGPHTAVLRGKNNGTGVGLVEVYDLESGTPIQLANISTRGQVQTGDNVMIGGFIIGGQSPVTVLLRAIGPSLPVNGALQDPTLELVDANGARIINDDWRETQEADIIASTVAPTNDRESAIVATLVPGFYTAVVRGKNDTVGVAVVEAYNLQ